MIVRMCLIFSLCFLLQNVAVAQSSSEATLTIRGLGGTLITGSQGRSTIFLNEVDGLGDSPNSMGDVMYDKNKQGAYYTVGLELVSSIQGVSQQPIALTAIRNPGLSGNELPADALYDADFNVKFEEGADIHLLSETRPFIIRSNLKNGEIVTQRKLGVFISENLAPGRYQASVIYSLLIQ